MKLINKQFLGAVSLLALSAQGVFVPPFGSGTAGGDLLTDSESDGLAVDFLAGTPDMLIRDSTATLNYSGDPFGAGKLSFVRASAAYYFNASGILTQAANDVPRYDHKLSDLSPRGLMLEPTRTNICLWSDDFTNAVWTKSNITAAKTATGPDGVANSASTLTATAANGTALQAITSSSAARITTMLVKRRTGTGNIDMTQDNGTTWTTVSVSGSWTRVKIPAATLANPTVGIRIVASGDEIDVAVFQHEVGSYETSPIPTTSSTVTRQGDCETDNPPLISTSAFPYSATAGTLFAEVEIPDSSFVEANGVIFALSAGAWTNQTRLGFNSGLTHLGFSVVNSSAAQANIFNDAAVYGTPFKLAGAWAANDFATSLNGGTVSTDSSGSIPTMDQMFLFDQKGNNDADVYGWVRKLKYLPRRASNAELQAFTS